MHRRFRLINVIVVLIVLMLLAGAAVLVFGRMDRTAEAYGTVRPKRLEIVRARIDGVIDTVYIDEDEGVSEGDTLLTILDEERPIMIERAERALEQARADLSRLMEERQNLVMSESFETQSAFASLFQAKQQAEIARRKYERAQTLREKGLISQEELEDDQLYFETAQSYYESLRDRAGLLEKRYALEIQKQQEQVRMAQSEFDHACAKLGKRYVVSPLTGNILTAEPEKLMGQRVTVGQPLLEIGDLSRMEFLALVSERDITRIVPGQQVRISISAFPHQKYKMFEGTVDVVPNTPEVSESGVFFKVPVTVREPWVDITASRLHLRPGLSGKAEIVLEKDIRILKLLLDTGPE